jgi:hypothetical protein
MLGLVLSTPPTAIGDRPTLTYAIAASGAICITTYNVPGQRLPITSNTDRLILNGRCALGLLDRVDFAKFDKTTFKNLHH